MEQDCTTVGKHLRTKDGTVKDKISKLPDELVVNILSHLSAEEIIRTSILSKRWKSVWNKTHTLKFNNKNHKRFFSDNVVSVLITHNGTLLRNLEIAVSHGCDPVDLGIWTAIAFSRKVSKLVLILNEAPGFVTFPTTMLMRENTLEILKLVGKIMLNIPIPCVTLRTLKELHLFHVRFEDGDTLSNLFDGCHGLQKLVVELYITSGVEVFEIKIPSLQSLTLGIFYCDEERFMISAPRLKHLNICKFHGVKSCVISDTNEISEAKIAKFKTNMDENVLPSITSVRQLTIHSPIKYPRGLIFDGLPSLVLDTDGIRWCTLLSHMLEGSPKLQNLKLIGGYYHRDVSTWAEPASIPECLLHTLETLLWTKYSWDEEYDYNVAQYILRCGSNLKTTL